MTVTKTKRRSSDEQRMLCTMCGKPNATRFYQLKKRKDGSVDRYVIYEHPDEPPVKEYMYEGKKIIRYRQCHAGLVRTISKLSDLLLPDPRSETETTEYETKPKSKKPSKQLQQIITKIGSTFMTLEDSINEALKLGRAEGFTDMEIGDMIRAEFKRLNRPRMTLSRYLPVTAKHMEKARPKSGFGNRMLPNRSVAINTIIETLPPTDTTIATKLEQKQLERPGYLNEEHECYKDIELKVLREENARLKPEAWKATQTVAQADLEIQRLNAEKQLGSSRT